MWTIIRFALRCDRDYDAAFEVLAHAGFHRHCTPNRGAPFPAAVVAYVREEVAAVTRTVFDALLEGGVAPVAVMACQPDVARPANSARALARA